MNDVTKRFIDICESNKISQLELMKLLNVSKQTINNVFKGRQNITVEMLTLFFVAKHEVDVKYIMTGIASIQTSYIDKMPEEVNKIFAEEKSPVYGCTGCIKKDVAIDMLKEQINSKDKKIDEQNQEIGMLKSRVQDLTYLNPLKDTGTE